MVDRKKAEQLYRKSKEILRSVQLSNGGCLATPKGERYPYVYPRDHAIIVLGFLSAGMVKEAKKGLTFAFECQLETGAFPQRIDTKGHDASYKPIQIDGSGLILYAFAEYVEKTKDIKFANKYWDRIEKAISYIIENVDKEKDVVFTPNSIHEFPPMEKGLEIWANAVCCGGVLKLSELQATIGHKMDSWAELGQRIRHGILKYMWNSRVNGFIKTIRLKESSSVVTDVDMSPYALADFHVIDDKDARVKKTVARIERQLWHKKLGGICRYPKYEGRNNGGWGPWSHFTLMLCRHFIRINKKKKADQYIDWVLKIAWKNMLPEHISQVSEFEEYVKDFTEAGLLRRDRLVLIDNARKHPMFKKGIAYITTPLAWPHAEFIRTWNLYKKQFLKK